jgi:hypothetical protein
MNVLAIVEVYNLLGLNLISNNEFTGSYVAAVALVFWVNANA